MQENNRPCLWALDLGTTMGWARRSTTGSITSGSEHFSGGGGIRFLKFQRWLVNARVEHGLPVAVFYEGVKNHKGVIAAHVYGGFEALTLAACANWGIPCIPVGVGTIKKHATRKGNAKKDQMIKAMRGKGFAPVDDNEADALALLQWGIWRGKIE